MIKPELCKDRKLLSRVKISDPIVEKKYDGERIIAIKKDNDIILQRRSGKIATDQYPEIVQELKLFEHDIVLDGEMCVFIDGKDNFNEGIATRTHLKDEKMIQERAEANPAKYMLFDILLHGDTDLREKPLSVRKKYLEGYYNEAIKIPFKFYSTTPNIQLVTYVDDAEKMLELAKEKGWEGIIIKPNDAMYIENSRKQWVKVKVTHDVDLIFTHYEENNRGIKLLKYDYITGDGITLDVSKDNPLSVQCGGAQADEVKAIIDDKEQVCATISYLNVTNKNRLRMPVFKKLTT